MTKKKKNNSRKEEEEGLCGSQSQPEVVVTGVYICIQEAEKDKH